jgi:hypothetical protein
MMQSTGDPYASILDVRPLWPTSVLFAPKEQEISHYGSFCIS